MRLPSTRITSASWSGPVTSSHGDHGTDLDRAHPRAGDLGGQADGLVEVGALQQVEAAEDLLGLGVGAVAGDDLAPAAAGDPDGGGGRGGEQGGAAPDVRAGLLAELAVLLGRLVVLGPAPILVLAVDERCVDGHGSSWWVRLVRRSRESSSMRRTGSP